MRNSGIEAAASVMQVGETEADRRYSSVDEIMRDLFPRAFREKQEERPRIRSAVPLAPISGRCF
jgi:hypothetical protein